jgi:hypothetical protein
MFEETANIFSHNNLIMQEITEKIIFYDLVTLLRKLSHTLSSLKYEETSIRW